MAFDVSFIYRIVDRYTPQLKRIKAATVAFGRRIGQLSGKALGGLVKSMGAVIAKGAAFASALSLGAVAFSVTKYAEAADAIAKFSKAIGTSANTVNEWRFAAERSGVSAGQMDKAMQRLFRNVGDFKSGTGELVTLLKGSPIFGQSLKDAATFDDQMDLVIGKLVKIKDPAQQAAAAAKFFGERVGPKMIPLLKEGVAGIAELRREAKHLHGGFTKEGVEAAEKFNDTLFDFQFALKGLRDKIGAEALPAMTKLVDSLKEGVVANRDMIATGIADWFKKVAEAVKSIPWADVIAQGKAFFAAAVRIVLVIDRIIKKVGGWKTAIAGLGIAAALAPIIAVLTPILKLVGLIAAGFVALSGLPVAAIAAIGAAVAGLAAAIFLNFDQIKEKWVGIWTAIKSIAVDFTSAIAGIFEPLGSRIGDFIGQAASFLGLGGGQSPRPAVTGANPLSAGGASAAQPVQLSGQIGVDVTGPGKVRESRIQSNPPGNVGFNVGMAGVAP